MSTEVEQKEKDRIEGPRGKIQELSSKGHSQREIAQILQVSSDTVNGDLSIKREKIQALSLAKECYSMKLKLLTNATVVDDAIRFISSQLFKESQKSSSSKSNED